MPGMKWSSKHRMWVDPDTRTPARRARDEQVAREAEADRERIDQVLRKVRAGDATESQDVVAHLSRSLLRDLIRARCDAGLSQAEVARRMGIPQPAIVRLEAGTHSPTLTTLARYASAVGVVLCARKRH